MADGEVLSVFVCEGEDKDDSESKSSNALKTILHLQGKVVIGNKALQMYHKNRENCTDLAKEWKKQTGLPFVFATFCVNSNIKYYDKIIKRFLKHKVKIPYYIKNREAHKLDLPLSLVELYLKKITYGIGKNEKRAIKLFLAKSNIKGN